MFKKLFFVCVGLLLATPANSLLGQGDEVILALRDGTEISGELLSVRDSSLVIDVSRGAWEADVPSHSKGIVIVSNQRVHTVVIRGKSNTGKGMVLGTLIGAGSGALLGLSSGDAGWFSPGEGAAILAVGFGTIGFLLGGVVGGVSSSPDKIVEPLPAAVRLSLANYLSAHQKDQVVVLSPRVGTLIDANEREKFRLFQQIRDFSATLILQKPDKSYYAQVALLGAGGETRDTTIQHNEAYLLMLAEQIDHFEDLEDGKYRMGQSPSTLRVARPLTERKETTADSTT